LGNTVLRRRPHHRVLPNGLSRPERHSDFVIGADPRRTAPSHGPNQGAARSSPCHRWGIHAEPSVTIAAAMQHAGHTAAAAGRRRHVVWHGRFAEIEAHCSPSSSSRREPRRVSDAGHDVRLKAPMCLPPAGSPSRFRLPHRGPRRVSI
jgi:hypothetical protein